MEGRKIKTAFFSLTKSDIDLFKGKIPEHVAGKRQADGYFTIGLVGREEENYYLLGMAQFVSNVTDKSKNYARLVHIYVDENFRRMGYGTKIVNKISSILENSGAKAFVFLLSESDDHNSDDHNSNMEIPKEEFIEFMKKNEFKEAAKKGDRLFVKHV